MKKQSVDQEAEEMAERKLQRIIARFGDAGGERLKPYYKNALIEEAKTAICWRNIAAVMAALQNDNAPVPTKATEA